MGMRFARFEALNVEERWDNYCKVNEVVYKRNMGKLSRTVAVGRMSSADQVGFHRSGPFGKKNGKDVNNARRFTSLLIGTAWLPHRE